ncbi:MAG: hypothetical protein DDT26_02612 [Dehalococcoidia bacterium]|nr:hypothetical protein [Chloroflexota bacterium]
MIAGQPVIVVETKRGYVDIPFALSKVFLVDGQTIPLQLQGDGVVLPTEDGFVVVPLEEFEVVAANGQVMLLAEVNAIFTIALAFLVAKYGAKALGGKAAAAGVGAVGGAVVDHAIIQRLTRP